MRLDREFNSAQIKVDESNLHRLNTSRVHERILFSKLSEALKISEASTIIRLITYFSLVLLLKRQVMG